jgi:hypothetical protein
MWSQEEDEKLMNLVADRKQQGWTWISEQIGTRSDVQCRYRYLQLQRDRGETPIPPPFDSRVEEILPKKKGRPLKIDLIPLEVASRSDPAEHEPIPPPRQADSLLDWSGSVTDDAPGLCW